MATIKHGKGMTQLATFATNSLVLSFTVKSEMYIVINRQCLGWVPQATKIV